MKKILMVALVLTSVISSCKKDNNTSNNSNNNTPTPVDQRNKFEGTWKGDINIVVPPEYQAFVPPGFPNKVGVTYVYSKNQNNSNELFINATVDPALQPSVEISNPLTATITGSSYAYKEFNITFKPPVPPTPPFPAVFTIKCTGTGTIKTDGKTIDEEGDWEYLPNVKGTWTSTLAKQP